MNAILNAFVKRPIRLVPVLFAGFILAAAGALMLPAAQAEEGGTGFLDAVFTSTSAIAVTGLVTVDTPTHWSLFGQIVILICMQIGGLGIMTTAAFLGLLASKKLGLRGKLMTQAELSPTFNLGDMKALITRAVVTSAIVEAAIALMLAIRFSHYGFGAGHSTWLGIFHAVSTFNNAGFGLFSDSMMSYATDPWIILPLSAGCILGGLGIPVIFELTRRGWGHRRWSVHTKMTLVGSGILLVGGWLIFLVFEWNNPATFGQWAWHERIMPAFFQSTVLRTSGFNSIDVGALRDDSILASVILMFIGGGAASTAGGIKVTTFFVLLWVIWAEVRGEPDVSAFRHRINPAVIREALAVALVYVAVNAGAILLMQRFEHDLELGPIMFEVTSALATVGQSTGITADLSSPSKVLLVFTMFVGRIGPVLFTASLAMRTRKRLYRYPEGRPLVG